MGGMVGFGSLPPVYGARSIAEKLGLAAGKVASGAKRLSTQLGTAVSDASESLLSGANVDRPTLADKIGNAVPRPAASIAPPGQAQVRASNRRAKMLDPGMAKSIDFAAQPTDMGTYIPESQKVTPSIRAGAYRDSPGFGNFGSSQPRSLAQMISDEQASRLLDETYGARMQANEAMAPDYQGDALKARLRDAEYEANSQAPRPLYSTGDTLGSFYGSGDSYANTPAGPTLKQQFQIQQDRLKNADKTLDIGRGRIAEELQTLQTQLDSEVRSGRRKPEDAAATYQRALAKAQELSGIMKSGFPPNDFR